MARRRELREKLYQPYVIATTSEGTVHERINSSTVTDSEWEYVGCISLIPEMAAACRALEC